MTRRRDDYYDDRDYRPRRSSSRRSYDDRGYDSRSSNRRYESRSSGGGYRRRRKSEREARIERITWGLLVLVFAVLYFLPGVSFPNWIVPLAGAVILIGSGIYQYGQHFRVSPITWMAGAVLALFAYYSLQTDANMTPFSLLTFAAIIVLGVVTGET